MTHFRIANFYIDELIQYGIDIPKFIFANIAPDCGVLNEDCLSYTPNKKISHFGSNDEHSYSEYTNKYLSNTTDTTKFSFYLGYYLHLLCDEAWAKVIYRPQKEKFNHLFDSEADAIWTFKRDWYDLDKLFLKN